MGTTVPIRTDSEEADLFQISSINMCGRGEEITRPYATTCARTTAERGSSSPMSCSVIQPKTRITAITKSAISHFIGRAPNGTELSEIPKGFSLQRRLGGAQRRLSGGGAATAFR